MAERQGFEPWIPFRVYTLSKRAPSATRPSLRWENVLQKRSRAAPCGLNGVCRGTLSRRNSIVTYWQAALRGERPQIRTPLLGTPILLIFLQLLRQIVRYSHFADGVQLAFEPVN